MPFVEQLLHLIGSGCYHSYNHGSPDEAAAAALGDSGARSHKTGIPDCGVLCIFNRVLHVLTCFTSFRRLPSLQWIRTVLACVDLREFGAKE